MAKNGVEVKILDKIKWLNERQIEEQMCHSALRNITAQYPLHSRKQRQELQECIKQPCRKFFREDFVVQIIMDCRAIPAVNFMLSNTEPWNRNKSRSKVTTAKIRTVIEFIKA